MRLLRWAALALAVAALAGAAFVRFAPDDPARWRADPMAAPPSGPNAHRVLPPEAPVFAVPAAALARAFDAMALAQPRTVRLDGGPEALQATYVQRSRLLRFPDYVSVRFLDLSDGRSTLALYSRARYGRSDFGVNRARADTWLAALDLPRA